MGGLSYKRFLLERLDPEDEPRHHARMAREDAPDQPVEALASADALQCIESDPQQGLAQADPLAMKASVEHAHQRMTAGERQAFALFKSKITAMTVWLFCGGLGHIGQYAFCVVDAATNYLFVHLLKSKSSHEVKQAMNVFLDTHRGIR